MTEMQGLGQHLGGLKSAAEAQNKLQELDNTQNSSPFSCEQLWKIFINHLGPHMVRNSLSPKLM